MESKAEMPAASGVQIRLYSVHPKFVPFIIYKQIESKAEMPAASGVQIQLYSVHPKFVPFIIYKQIESKAEMPAASGVQIRLYSVHPKFVSFIIHVYKQWHVKQKCQLRLVYRSDSTLSILSLYHLLYMYINSRM